MPPGHYATVAGLILDGLGRIPDPGEYIDVVDWRFEVVDATERGIRRVRFTRLDDD